MNNINLLLPHGFCIKWTPELLWLYVVSDGLIVLAYYSIPFTLAYFVWKRKDLQFRWIFMLFSAFILACGTTHLLGIVILWNPIYWIDASMKAITAVVSVITSISLVLLMPKALKLPSPAQLEKEVQERLEAYDKLQAAQSSLVDMTKLIKAEEAKNMIATDLKATLEAIPDLLFEIDMDGRYIAVQSAKNELLVQPVAHLLGKLIDDVLPPIAVATIKNSLKEAVIAGFSRGSQIELEVPAGRRWFELSIAKKLNHNTSNPHFIVLSRDITERKLAEMDLSIAATAFEAQEGIIVTDADTKILRVNHAFTEITGYSAEEAIGQRPSFLSSGQHDKHFYQDLWDSLNSKGSWEGEIWNRRKNGVIYPERLVITAVKDNSGNVTNYVATLADITESKAASDKIKNLAFYDPLTQLPNRRLLQDRLDQALAASNHSKLRGALLFLDIDHFKILNDTLGHSTGDLLLQIIATRLKSCVRESDTVARIGGDEFVVLLEDLSADKIEAASYTESVAIKILQLLAQPYKLESHQHMSSVSMGATLFHGHESNVDELLKQADIAMYQAKESGRNALRFFDIEMQNAITRRANMEREMRYAIENDQFVLHYQIQVNHQKKPIGAEALIRWQHPQSGIIPPAQFIPLAEDTGLILSIGEWVLNKACAQLKCWQMNAETRELSMAVNVSAKQLMHQSFKDQLESIVQAHDVDPAFLKLELTESMLLENTESMINKMIELRRIGVRFELDDFGTGYSSLQYLKQLPLSQLKIDQSFVRDIAVDDNDKTLVRTIIAMAHSLDLKVIAEGVETEEQRQFLIDHGCNHFQGYLFGKPMPIEAFELQLMSKI